jgi:hypothetical protein
METGTMETGTMETGTMETGTMETETIHNILDEPDNGSPKSKHKFTI